MPEVRRAVLNANGGRKYDDLKEAPSDVLVGSLRGRTECRVKHNHPFTPTECTGTFRHVFCSRYSNQKCAPNELDLTNAEMFTDQISEHLRCNMKMPTPH